MTRGRELVEEDVEPIAELLMRGYSTHEIGAMLGIPQRTVSYRLAKFGWKSRYLPHVQKKKIKEYTEKVD
jgi:hypothetical protein